MAEFDEELLGAAHRLIARRAGQGGKLSSARIRRSISTSYYALFHFLIEEVGLRVAGSGSDLRRRRRVLARSLTHRGIKTALDKVRSLNADPSVSELLRGGGIVSGPIVVPNFVRDLAFVFSTAQEKRHEADYDLNRTFEEADALFLAARVRDAIRAWRSAKSPGDRDFKHALCILFLLKGQLKGDGA